MIAARWYWLGLIACASLMAIAYFYFQQKLGLAPCPLCMFQRACLVGIGTLCLLGILFKPTKVFAKLLALGVLIFSVLGMAIAGRQVWLQNLPEDLVPECGPDLSYMLDAFPLAEVIETVLRGSGECAEVQWQFLTFSMPTWMVFVFGVMSLIALKLLFSRERRYFNKPYANS